MALIELLVINLLISNINSIDFIRHEDTNFQDLSKTQLGSDLIKSAESGLSPAIKKLSRSLGKDLPGSARQLKQTKYKVYMEDLESTLYAILYDQISVVAEIQGIKLVVLKEFLSMCDIFFPRASVNAHIVLKEIKNILGTKQVWTRDFIWRIVAAAEIRHSLIKNTWITCKDENNKVQCGMWLLFHTFTTEAYAGPEIDTDYRIKALNYIVNYIQKFNPSLAPQLEQDPEIPLDIRAGILWLWKVGNKARNFDYPDRTVCRGCRNPDGSFDDNYLFKFIMDLHYSAFYQNGTEVKLFPKAYYRKMQQAFKH